MTAPIHVLVVEDDAAARGLLHVLFEREGYAVTDASTLEEALSAIASDAVDIVILDLVLGARKSGLDVLRTLREHAATARLPVIILTGAPISEWEEEQIRNDRAYVFYKPPKFRELLDYVARLVRR